MIPHLIGMTHLPPMPGSPAWDGTPFPEIVAHGVNDARVLKEAGFDAVLVQNSLDRPTRPTVDALTIAFLTAVAERVRADVGLATGINIVKNDGPAAVAIAAATGAGFVRVKHLTGSSYSAEGVLSGNAFDTMSMRARSGARPDVLADLVEPTSRVSDPATLVELAVDALDFGMADGVIVTGHDTAETLELTQSLRDSKPAARIVIGGRIDADSVGRALRLADAVIIGSALKTTPGIRGAVDFDAARRIVDNARRSHSE